MIKKLALTFVALVAFVFIGCGGGGSGVFDWGWDFTNNDGQFNDMQNQIDNIKYGVAGDDNVITNILNQLDQITATDENQQTQINELYTLIEQLRSDMNDGDTTLQNEIDDLQNQLDELKVKVDTNTTDISTLQGRIDELCKKIWQLSKKVCVLFSKFSALSSQVAIFGLVDPVGDLGTGYYLNIETGVVFQFVDNEWVVVGQLETGAGESSIKPPMFVFAEKLDSNQVRLTWTASEGAVAYDVYAAYIKDGTIYSALVAHTSDPTFTVTVGPDVSPLSVSPWPAPAKDLAYVVVAVDENAATSEASYAVGPLTGNAHD